LRSNYKKETKRKSTKSEKAGREKRGIHNITRNTKAGASSATYHETLPPSRHDDGIPRVTVIGWNARRDVACGWVEDGIVDSAVGQPSGVVVGRCRYSTLGLLGKY